MLRWYIPPVDPEVTAVVAAAEADSAITWRTLFVWHFFRRSILSQRPINEGCIFMSCKQRGLQLYLELPLQTGEIDSLHHVLL